MTLTDILAGYLVWTKAMLYLAAFLIIVSSLDDAFIDIYYWCRRIYREFTVYRRFGHLTVEQLREKPEQPLAIMVPAWQESPVIAKMIDNAVSTFEYTNYVIFAGTYPNDPDTGREVEMVRERYPNVYRVVTPHDGPTSKADCLNWVIQAIRVYEEDNDMRFAGVIMHDAEDVVHPLELRLFNWLIDRFDFIQLPVYPLETRWWQMTAGHYMDEFAENHGKDLVVRESLAGHVPCAGVAACFSRHTIDTVAAASDNIVFDTGSVTEDYQFSFRMQQLGLHRQIFVRFGIERTVKRRPLPFMEPRDTRVLEYVATREFFPTKMRDAVKQKGRWIVGIVFQGWENIGWRGSFVDKYILMRDRKSIITSTVTILGYFIALNIAVMWFVETLFPWIMQFPALVEKGSALEYMMWLNGFFLMNRLVQRILFVNSVYGPFQAALTFPRQMWGNIINFFAVWRAIRLFIRYLITGKMISWDKTAHHFPNMDELRSFHRKIGDLLLERNAVSPENLNAALERKSVTGQTLGEVLLDQGWVEEDELYGVLGRQMRIPLRNLDPYEVPDEVIAMVPASLAQRYEVFPVSLRESGALEIASHRILETAELQNIADVVGRAVVPVLTTRSDLGFALRRGFVRPGSGTRGKPLGLRLVNDGLITETELQEALRDQRRSYMTLGTILVRNGVITRPRLDEAVYKLNDAGGGRLGDFLVANGYVAEADLEKALFEQRSLQRSIGEVLIGRKAISREQLESYLAQGAA